MYKFAIKIVPFFIVAVLIVTMAVATVVEKYTNTWFVRQFVYQTEWFIALWILLVFTGLFYIFKCRLYRKRLVFMIHISLVIILVGALITNMTGKQGTIHLRQGMACDTYMQEMKNGHSVETSLPFSFYLDSFQIVLYPGTNAPADYISHFTVSDKNGNRKDGVVSMNQIFRYKGIRLYQSSYDDDGHGTYLTVNIDRWGIPVTYTGYFLFFISMIGLLLDPKGGFRRLLRHPLLRKGAFIVLLLSSFVANAGATAHVLPRDVAARFGKLPISYNGRIVPLQTLAYAFTEKLTGGERSFRGFTPEQILTGWIFFDSDWSYVSMIKVDSRLLRHKLEVPEYSSLNSIMKSPESYLLNGYALNNSPGTINDAINHLTEKVQLIQLIRQGTLLKLFPYRTGKTLEWYSPVSELPLYVPRDERGFVNYSFDFLYESILKENYKEVFRILDQIEGYQKKNASEQVPSAFKVKTEMFYNSVPLLTWLYQGNLLFGFLALVYTGLSIIMRRQEPVFFKSISRVWNVSLWSSFFILTLILLLRTYLSGRLPVSNGYETMLVMVWFIEIITLFWYRRFLLLLPLGLLLSGFFLLVASIGRMDPQITPLQPILSSPLLSIHVSLIMMAYALLSFTFMNALIALSLIVRKKIREGKESVHVVRLQILSKLFLYVALVLLGIGIFVGAIWANISWGSYWSWDPKEVWALITLLVYAIGLHGKSFPSLNRSGNFHFYQLAAFVTVLMTYLGVNYFLGGMHSYAG